MTDAFHAKKIDPTLGVPWSSFDLINAFNAWKKSEAAGRVFVVAADGTTTTLVTGLGWRQEVSAQVFEEAAVDLGRALAAYGRAKAGTRRDRRVGFPKRKRKGRCRDSFRIRNKTHLSGRQRIRIGDGHARSVTLPTIGTIRVHDDTRRLRQLLRPVQQDDSSGETPSVAPGAKILFATIARRGDRWHVNLTVEAPDFHPRRRHPPVPERNSGDWVGIDRGLAVFAVAATADRAEVGRWDAPRPLGRRLGRLRSWSRALARKQRSSRKRAKAARRLVREHARIFNARRSFLHEVSSHLAKTHSQLVIEDLAVANLLSNRHLARAIGDAGWAELARQLTYKAAWFGADLRVCDRWFASTRTCSACGELKQRMGLAERTFHCDACGLVCDRDRNAAANLAAWAERVQAPDRQAGGRVINAPGGEGAGHHLGDGETGPTEGGTDTRATSVRAEDAREGRRRTSPPRLVDALYP